MSKDKINEFQEQMMTEEFLKELAEQGVRNIAKLEKTLEYLKSISENQDEDL